MSEIPTESSLPSSEGPSNAPNGWSWAQLRAFRKGERWALAAVYEQYAETVATLLRHGFSFQSGGRHHRFVGYRSPFEFQDALHEAFRLAFEARAREGYDGVRPYGPYLRTIARNVVLRSFRARERLFPTIDEDAEPEMDRFAAGLISLPESPEDSIQVQQIRSLVQRFLAELTAEERHFIQLRFVDGRPQREVAETLGLGRQRIRTREQKLKRRLIAFLRERGATQLLEGGALLGLLGAEFLQRILEVSR